jgi:hypothetical protein
MRPWRKKGMAARADRHDLYQRSVQDVESEIDFVSETWSALRTRPARLLREDFCGTFAVCCSWVKSNPKRTAMGVDLCGETLAWGRENNLAKLDEEQQGRIRLVEQDVRKRNRPQVDVLAAQNFSFWIFKTRAEVSLTFAMRGRTCNPMASW